MPLLVTLTIGDFFGEGTLLEHLDGRKVVIINVCGAVVRRESERAERERSARKRGTCM